MTDSTSIYPQKSKRQRKVIEKVLFLTVWLLETSVNEFFDWVECIKRRDHFGYYLDWKKWQRNTRRALKAGYLEKTIKNGQPVYRITTQGTERLEKTYPLMRLRKQKWDGKWRIVVFDIPENKRKVRDKLRWELEDWGLGMLQRSTWITPYSLGKTLKEVLSSQGLSEYIVVFEGANLFDEDETKLATKVWQLGKVNRKYEKWLDKVEKGKISQKLIDEYLEILEIDPFLPHDLLPVWWAGDEAYEVFWNLIKNLSKTAAKKVKEK